MAIAAVLTLSLSIGTNAGMVGLVARALFSPPPHLTDPDRLVNVAFERGEGDQRARMVTTSYVTYRALRDSVNAFAGVAAWQRTSTAIAIEGEEQRHADGVLVSGNYFDVLGAAARLGRPVQPADDRPASDPVVVLSHAFWRSVFGSDAAVLGRRLSIGGLDYVVAGVMPPGFSGHSSENVDVWMPFAAAMRKSPGWDQQPFMNVAAVFGRISPQATPATVVAQASAAVNHRVVLSPLSGGGVTGTDGRVALWLSGVSGLVLVIGLANAATLLIVRAMRRRRELAIRMALGAGRGRLLRLAFVEGAILSGIAVVVSLVAADWFDAAVRQVLLPGLAPADTAGRAALAAALAAGCVAAAITGLANAATIPRALAASTLDADRHSSRRSRAQTVLLVLQTSLSVVLLCGAGLFGRSLHNLLAQDFGMRMDGVFVVDFEDTGGGSHGDDPFGAALDQVRHLPGVRSATVIGALPFAGHNVPPIAVPGRAEPPNVEGQLPFLQPATPQLFDILGITIVEGRALTAGDEAGAPVVVVNQAMARSIWPGESALGKCIRIGFDPGFDPETAVGPPTPSAAVPCRQVVGVARDIRQRSLVPDGAEARLMQYFVPYSQVPVPPFVHDPDRAAWGLLVSAAVPADSLAPAIRRAVVGGRTDLPFVRVRPYAQLLDRQVRPWRLGTTLLAMFSGLALVVGAVGLYAAFTHAVMARRQEMAIRLAIGARPVAVVTLVLRESLTIAAIGVVAGCATAVAGGRSLQALLYQTSGADPAILTGAAAVMLAVATVATILPARAASRADPATLLRS